MQERETIELDLRRVFYALKKRWYWLAGGLAVGLAIAVFVTAFYIPKSYTSRTTLYVYSTSDPNQAQSAGDTDSTTRIANNCVVVLTDPDVLQKAANKLSRPISAGALRGIVSVDTIEDSDVLAITASTSDPVLSAEICNAVASVAPDVLQHVVKRGSVEVISTAKPAAAPSGPNAQKNALAGALLGLVLMALASIVVEMMDKTIKSQADLKERTNLPVLGEIPLMDIDWKRG